MESSIQETKTEKQADKRSALCILGLLLRKVQSKRPIALEDLKEYLKDRDGGADGICRYPNMDDPPEEHYATVTAVVMNLETREMWITDGQPDVNPFVHVKLEG